MRTPTEELVALQERVAELESTLEPFSHPDLCFSGAPRNDAEVIFCRGEAQLTIADFRRAAKASRSAK